MIMSIAKEIKKKIDRHYVGSGIAESNLGELLKKGLIDLGEQVETPTTASVKGSCSDLGSSVFTYADGSVLIVSDFEVLTAKLD